MIRTFIADDHSVVRAGIRQILASCEDIEIVGEASNGNEVLRGVRNDDVDVLLLDMSMPGHSGVSLIKDIRREHPSVRVLVLSMHNEDQYAVRTIKAGAHGYLTKTTAPEVLVAAMRRVATGRMYVTETVAEALAQTVASGATPRHARLSDREHQVFLMLAHGCSVTRVAEELRLSAKTVSTHKTRILQKLELSGVADLVRYAVRERLIEEPQVGLDS